MCGVSMHRLNHICFFKKNKKNHKNSWLVATHKYEVFEFMLFFFFLVTFEFMVWVHIHFENKIERKKMNNV